MIVDAGWRLANAKSSYDYKYEDFHFCSSGRFRCLRSRCLRSYRHIKLYIWSTACWLSPKTVCWLALSRSDRHVLALLLCAGHMGCAVLWCDVLEVDVRRQHARTRKNKTKYIPDERGKGSRTNSRRTRSKSA